MKKVYIAKNMIINSRLVRLYENSPQEKKEYMMRRVGELITEYKSFQYPPLYGYLCNIFCSVAVCEYDEEHGMTRDRAIEEVRTAMEDFMRPIREKYEKIFGIGVLWPLLRKVVPKLMCSANGHGFETSVVEGPKNLLAFDTTECIFATILNGMGRNDLACMFCSLDEFMYSNLPGIEFRRTGTCCRGDEKCDFRFIHDKKR